MVEKLYDLLIPLFAKISLFYLFITLKTVQVLWRFKEPFDRTISRPISAAA